MLEVKNISSGYGKKQVLYDVSLKVKPGEVVLLIGGNGSGKSTLLKCIYNLLPLWTGEIFFKGEKISGLKPSDLIKRGIVYIPQKDFYFENLTVEENLQISGNTLPKERLKERIRVVYETTGLDEFRKRNPFNLSGGERKLLGFGMGLVHEPRLLLFDEPLAGVDSKNSAKLLEIFDNAIKAFVDEVIIIEHKDDAKEIFNRKIILELGNLKN